MKADMSTEKAERPMKEHKRCIWQAKLAKVH
jgi:hypothetical protein